VMGCKLGLAYSAEAGQYLGVYDGVPAVRCVLQLLGGGTVLQAVGLAGQHADLVRPGHRGKRCGVERDPPAGADIADGEAAILGGDTSR
jgi:hypothetical protein